MPEEYVEQLEERGIENLWEPQAEALDEGLLEEENFLMVSPPGTGKTLSAEIVIVHELLTRRNSSIFLVPYKSLAEEKRDKFKKTLGQLGLKITSSVGGETKEKETLHENDIIILTYEKFDYYLRNHDSFLEGIGCVVVDEFHKINDEKRGPYLEISITRIKDRSPDTRIIGLSATTPNAEEIAEWMNGVATVSEWNKNEVKEGIAKQESRQITFYEDDEESTESFNTYTGEYKTDCVLDYLENEEDSQALVFAPKRKSARDKARQLSKYIDENPRSYNLDLNKEELDEISKKIDDLPYTQGKTLKQGKKFIKKGIGLHHAGLPLKVKNVIEDAFKEGYLKAIVATTTLAAGVNLPVDRIFLLKPRVGGDSEEYGRDLSTAEYKNLAGRSGRPDYTDRKGEAVIFSQGPLKAQGNVNQYIEGSIDPVTSKIDLAEDPEILLNILQDNKTRDEVIEFLQETLKAHSENSYNLEEDIEVSLERLEGLGMIEIGDDGFQITDLGDSVSRKWIDPRTAKIVLDYISSTEEIELKHLLIKVISSPGVEQELMWFENASLKNRSEVVEEYGLQYLDDKDVEKTYATYKAIEVWIGGETLSEFIEESYLNEDRWGVADIRDRLSPTMCRVVANIGEIIEETYPELEEKFSDEIEKIKYRIQYGLTEDEVQFASEGVCFDRNMIQHLIDSGYENPERIIETEVHDFPLGLQKAVELKTRGIKNKLEGREMKKELLLTKAQENRMDPGFYQKVLESDKDEFESYALDLLSDLDNFEVTEENESGQVMKPEAYGRILDENGDYIEDEEGKPIKIGIEAKTRENLEGKVGPEKATKVVTKAPDADIQMTVGSPEFNQPANDKAKRNDIILINSVSLAEISIKNEMEIIEGEKLYEMFSGRGRIKIPFEREILY